MNKNKNIYIVDLNVTSYDSCTSYPEVTVDVKVMFPSRGAIQCIDINKLRRKLLDVISDSVELTK